MDAKEKTKDSKEPLYSPVKKGVLHSDLVSRMKENGRETNPQHP